MSRVVKSLKMRKRTLISAGCQLNSLNERRWPNNFMQDNLCGPALNRAPLPRIITNIITHSSKCCVLQVPDGAYSYPKICSVYLVSLRSLEDLCNNSQVIELDFKIIIKHTNIEGILIISPRRFGDDRGFFCETWSASTLTEHGINTAFVQDNQSLSGTVGTVRGLHYQSPPHAQDKLVRCGRGALLDVAVDIRLGSPTYGEWVGVELTAKNGRQLLIPKGFLHGFVTLEADTEILYKCSDYYAPDCDGAIRFDDPDIGIDWGILPEKALLSQKDAAASFLKDFESPFTYEATK